MPSQINVDQINPTNPLVPVNITGPSVPTYNGVPLTTGASTPSTPTTPAGAAQTAVRITAGIGVPTNSQGSDGWFYFRSDGTTGSAIYQRRSGVWVAIL